MKEIFLKGGPVMWPLLVCSILSLTISLERAIFWWKQKREQEQELTVRVFGPLSPVPQSLGDASREAMELAAEDEIERMRRGLDVLDTMITMAPLLGILGTVLGIIDSFNMLANAGIADPRAATGGIAQALITTAVGLTVALVALLPFNYFVNRIKSGTRTLNKIIVRAQC